MERRDRGWAVHPIVDAFPADAQDIPDEEWISHGLDRSWIPLSKDGPAAYAVRQGGLDRTWP